ncbi:Transposase, IS30 family [Piscirickettsia salmonis]|uniref:IS30 family transposase n=3 Tax=Piscirickettsia salmonis TaxID=1238 RepID=UPI001E559AFA|nr:IS30 family transposase [Piscirickettsia salmonis]QGP54011.1 Transposase, IS30 family [Piscirickettsia salmonis]QGP60090.1 Transposase, IS30 family [Piscirickettsia salmonis]QGP63587.1 Transposase, IS30 family [Piscirickettsia salmonis]
MAYRHLNEKDRFYIEQRLSEGDSMRSIARALGFAPSTVSRETKRHTPSDFNGLYCHRLASRCAQEKRSNAKQGQDFQKISEKAKVLIHERLSTHTSPDVISKELIQEHNIQVSESTIYRYIHEDREKGGELYKSLPHSGKPYKKKVKSGDKTKIPNRVGIEQRPAIADEKTEFGHFENKFAQNSIYLSSQQATRYFGKLPLRVVMRFVFFRSKLRGIRPLAIDTIVGRDHKSYLLTLVDKANKMCCIRKMANKCAETVVETFRSIVASTFFDFKTITSDNGTEFAGHEDISKITDADFYFARPYRSCDRGLNEHTNGLIRRFLPKGTDFNEISDAKIAKIEHTLNARRRASLDYRAPNHVFLENLMAA